MTDSTSGASGATSGSSGAADAANAANTADGAPQQTETAISASFDAEAAAAEAVTNAVESNPSLAYGDKALQAATSAAGAAVEQLPRRARRPTRRRDA